MKNGGYETTRDIEAKTEASARRKAKEWEKGCAYGTMTLLKLELNEGEK